MLEGGEPHARCPYLRRVSLQPNMRAFRPLRCALLSARGGLFIPFKPPLMRGVVKIRKPGDTRRTAAGPVSSLIAPGISSSTARRTAARTAWRCRRTRTTNTATSSTTTPRGGPTSPPRRAQPLLLLSRSNPPTEGGGRENPLTHLGVLYFILTTHLPPACLGVL